MAKWEVESEWEWERKTEQLRFVVSINIFFKIDLKY